MCDSSKKFFDGVNHRRNRHPNTRKTKMATRCHPKMRKGGAYLGAPVLGPPGSRGIGKPRITVSPSEFRFYRDPSSPAFGGLARDVKSQEPGHPLTSRFHPMVVEDKREVEPHRTGTAMNDFARAARQRWSALEEELKADVAQFNSSHGSADFSGSGENQFRVSNSDTGLQLTITADFAGQTIDYDYSQVNDRTAGVPEGGMLSMRETPVGTVEFYSADEPLTAEEARQVLLEPVLFPPEKAA